MWPVKRRFSSSSAYVTCDVLRVKGYPRVSIAVPAFLFGFLRPCLPDVLGAEFSVKTEGGLGFAYLYSVR